VITKKIYLYAAWDEYTTKWNYFIADNDEMDSVGWVVVDSKTIEFDRPPAGADWSKEAVALTRAEIEKIRAEAEVKCEALRVRINSMLAIENKT